jgi:hypothetical protein
MNNEFLKSLFNDFGQPVRPLNALGREPSTFADGVRCGLNPTCRKANTPDCDLINCQKPTTIRASRLDGTNYKDK